MAQHRRGPAALLTLTQPRKGERLADLAAGFGPSAATACRRARETIRPLASRNPELATGLRIAERTGTNTVILDRTLIPNLRNRIDRPCYSSKHQCHGMHLQAVTDERGGLLWISGAIPGAVRDTTAARTWQIPQLLAEASMFASADKGYRGIDDNLVLTPLWGRGKPAWQQDHNRLHARLHAPGERTFTQLKKSLVLDQLHCDPHRTTEIAKAIQALNHYEAQAGCRVAGRNFPSRPPQIPA